jgi:hypothetical protein
MKFKKCGHEMIFLKYFIYARKKILKKKLIFEI